MRIRAHVFTSLTAFIAVAGVLVLAQTRDWPSERPPRPLEARPVSFPPYEIRSLANGMRVVVVRQDEQPVVSLRLLVRAGAAQDPKERPGRRVDGLGPARSGDEDQDGEPDRGQHRLHRRCPGHRCGNRSFVRERHRDEGQPRGRARSHLRRRPQPGVLRRRARSPERAGAAGAQGELRGSRLRGQHRRRAPDLRLPSLRTAVQRHPRIARAIVARGSLQVSPDVVRAEQLPARGGGRRHRRRRDDRRRARIRCLAAKETCRRSRRSIRRSPRAVSSWSIDQRGADRDSRRSAGDSTQEPGLPAAERRGEDSRRRRRQPVTRRVAIRARPHLRRLGRHGRVSASGLHHCRDRYADRDHRRGTPARGRRVLPHPA